MVSVTLVLVYNSLWLDRPEDTNKTTDECNMNNSNVMLNIAIYFKCNPASRSLLNRRVMGRVRVRRPGNELGTQRDWAGG